VYSAKDEETLRDRELIREWTASGFLDSVQKTSLLATLKTDLRLTNGFLRAVLFFFAVLIVIAGVGLMAATTSMHGRSEFAGICLVSGLICGTLAELICRNRFYRYGAEEALGVSAVVLFSISIAQLLDTPGSATSGIAGLLAGTLGGVALYLRFGFVYAAIGSIAGAAAIPFQLSVNSDEKRLLSALVLAAVLVLTRRMRLGQREVAAGSAGEAVEAAAWLGMYVALNVQILPSVFAIQSGLIYRTAQSSIDIRTWFYFLSWAMVWILPAAGLWLGLRRKDRLVIVANLAMALMTLTTNKRYLGWPIHSWDPMLFGILLMTTAILIRRWLQHGPNAARHGFTAARILRSDEGLMAAVSIASAVVHPHIGSREPAVSKVSRLQEGGGQSGGGGASGSF
jgi:hypothetical protein